MMIGATVLCGLVLLVLLTDRLGARVWTGEEDRAFYRCESCDLRYPRREIRDPRLHLCPAGHPVALEQRRASAGVLGIFVCLGFLVVAVVLILSGIGSNP